MSLHVAAAIKEQLVSEFSSKKMDTHQEKTPRCIVLLTTKKEKHRFREFLLP